MANDDDQSPRPQRLQHDTRSSGGSGALYSDTTTTTSQGQGSYTSWPPYLNP
jgi:hypothetical protein